MRATRMSLPEVGLIAGTRAALGAGIAFLLSDRLTSYRKEEAVRHATTGCKIGKEAKSE